MKQLDRVTQYRDTVTGEIWPRVLCYELKPEGIILTPEGNAGVKIP